MTATDYTAATPFDDRLNAFCPDNQIAVEGSGQGPLAGLTFAAKDVFDVAGAATGNGHPDWLRTHAPAERSAVAVERLLAAGAKLVGKTISDELAYSLTGENFHYGTPVNPADPSRVPGGSSSGSASVTAAGVVDFALGSDCGGSVRVPASYCGILGMRPTHGRVSLEGAVPFAPSFDCAGWFARDTAIFERVGRVLLGDETPARPVMRILYLADAFAMLEDEPRASLDAAVQQVEARAVAAERVVLAEEGLDSWSQTFRTLQAAEIWKSTGAWLTQVEPEFGPGVKERFAAARTVDPDLLDRAKAHRREIVDTLATLLRPGTVLVLPTVPRGAPERGGDASEIEVTYRNKAMNLLSVAGLAGLPQISLPLARHGHLPLGLSIVGPRGSDVDLLALASGLVAG